jgi:hypothetical protein
MAYKMKWMRNNGWSEGPLRSGETADKYYVIEKMNELVLAFVNVYLKGEGSFTAGGPY